jgi:hypothetical protein
LWTLPICIEIINHHHHHQKPCHMTANVASVAVVQIFVGHRVPVESMMMIIER